MDLRENSPDCGITDNLPMPALDSPVDHLIIPYAHASAPDGDAALQDLQLPNLQAVLQSWQQVARDDADEYTLSPPHERAWAHALGWTSGNDGAWPWAAWQAQKAQQPCAWFSPCHFSVGMEQVSLVPPDALDLRADESQTLLDALAPWALEDGITLTMETPQRWLASGEVFRDLPWASLDRVAHRRVDAWLPQSQSSPAAQMLLRLQNEAQMLFYTHPMFEARQNRGVLPINGFWVSGAGVWDGRPSTAQVTVNEVLRQPALQGDPRAWQAAWTSLDHEVIGPWLNEPTARTQRQLVLCGERAWAAWGSPSQGSAAPSHQPWWKRWLGPGKHTAPTVQHTLSAL